MSAPARPTATESPATSYCCINARARFDIEARSDCVGVGASCGKAGQRFDRTGNAAEPAARWRKFRRESFIARYLLEKGDVSVPHNGRQKTPLCAIVEMGSQARAETF